MMFWVAVVGLLVNVTAFIILMRGEKENLNVRAAALHVAGDLLGSVAAIVASIVIVFTGWTLIDPILSVLVTVIILKAAWSVVKESGHILLEGTPEGFDKTRVESVLNTIDGVHRVHHLHAWSVTRERPMVTLEVTLNSDADSQAVKNRIKATLAEDFNISHTTVEVDDVLS